VIGASLCVYFLCARERERNLPNRLPADVPPPVLPNFIIVTWRVATTSGFHVYSARYIKKLRSRSIYCVSCEVVSNRLCNPTRSNTYSLELVAHIIYYEPYKYMNYQKCKIYIWRNRQKNNNWEHWDNIEWITYCGISVEIGIEWNRFSY